MMLGCCFSRAGLQGELQAAHKESEYVRQRIRHLENDLAQYRQKNQDLEQELEEKTGEFLNSLSSHSHFGSNKLTI